MTADSHEPAEFEGRRWKAVRLGLRLANSHLGAGAIVCFYALWGLIGLILSFVLIPFAIGGKLNTFADALNPFALYGFVLPMALMAAATWSVKLIARLLWCGIPKPQTAALLAYASVAGRLSVFFAVGYVWRSGGSLNKGLLLPETMACAGIAGLGLVAEWGFLQILRRDFVPAPEPILTSDELDNAVEDPTEAVKVTEQNKKTVLTRDVGEWFKGRFPRAHKFVAWILLPLTYVVYVFVSSFANDGNLQSVLDAILRLAVIAPAFLQVFWIPGGAIHGLTSAFSSRTVRENFHST